MLWRLLLAGSIAASLGLAHLLPHDPTLRLLAGGLFFSIAARLAFAVASRIRSPLGGLLSDRNTAAGAHETAAGQTYAPRRADSNATQSDNSREAGGS